MNIEFESDLSPLFLGQQVVGLGVVPDLDELDPGDIFKERVRSFLPEEGLDVLKHGLREGPLEYDFITALVGTVQVRVYLG